jgi:two-component system sensor histidine kinase/response regulator
MRPQSAAGGAEALAMLRAAAQEGDPYAVALLDLHMPGLDGVELAQAIRDEPLLSGVRLVLLTSVGDRGDAQRAREAGIEAVLTKPVRVRALHEGLTRVLGTPSSAAGAAGPANERRGPSGSGTKANVLVVEDNVVNQKVAARMLETLGHRVDVAANGLEAVKALSEIPYDVVLMDCQMPDMDGYAATAEIRRREGSDRHTPIIAMTASAMRGDEDRARAAGMDDYVSKPVAREKLAEVLDRWLPPKAEVQAQNRP